MRGIKLNLTRRQVLLQEGPGLAKKQYRHERYRHPGQRLARGIVPGHRPDRAGAPSLNFQGRTVFGLRAFQFMYTANPHTGLYDTIGVNMLSRTPDRPDRMRRFHAIRAKLIKRFGKPEWEAFYVHRKLRGKTITRNDMAVNRFVDPRPGLAFARRRVNGVSFELSTEYGRPLAGTAYVVGLYVWLPSAELNYSKGVHRTLSHFFETPLPPRGSRVLYRPPSSAPPRAIRRAPSRSPS